MNTDIFGASHESYLRAMGVNDMPRNADGYIILKPSADHVDRKAEKLTTDISSLEQKLKEYRKKKVEIDEYKDSDDYKESKKKKKDKKSKKAKTNLLEMIFNNADHEDEDTGESDDEDDEENYRDIKKRKPRKTNTLDSTYGKRFSPVVSLLHDTIRDFDGIADEIKAELDSARGQTKGMYRSSQISNLISAKSSKLSAVDKLASIAKTVSDLEYKREKDQKAEHGGNENREIARIGAKYLRSSFLDDDDDSDTGGKKKKKKGKDREPDYGKQKKAKDRYDDDDDDEDDEDDKENQKQLANELAQSLINNKSKIKLTAHEKFISMEGKYDIVVIADPLNPEKTWRYMAISRKTGKEIPNFEDEYEGLLPKRKAANMSFDLGKAKCTDKATRKVYKMLFTR